MDLSNTPNLFMGNDRIRIPDTLLYPKPSQVEKYKFGQISPYFRSLKAFPDYCRRKVLRYLFVECRSTITSITF